MIELGGLTHYPYAWAARAFLLEQLDRDPTAEWTRAAELARSDAERSYFRSRIR